MGSDAFELASVCRELEQLLGPKQVSTAEPDLAAYSRDMWPRLLLATQGGEAPRHRPQLVVWPEDVREIAAVVKVARRRGLPIVPYGGGSGVCGGAVPLFGGITIDTKRMQGLRAVAIDDLVCDVDGGLSGERFERELARRGYTFGHFPSSIYCSTVGGWLATRAAGQLSTKYGKVEDRVAGLTVVTGEGEIVETDGPSRALRGPNWTQLIVGSEGTLGIIASARLRVAPAPQLQLYRGFEFAHVEDGLEAIRRVMHAGLRPAVVRLYDEVDTLLHGGDPDPDAPLDSRRTDGDRAPAPGVGEGALPRWPKRDDGPRGPLDRLRALAKAKRQGLRQDAMRRVLGHGKWLHRGLDVINDQLGRGRCRMIIGLEGARIRTEVEAALTFAELERAGAVDLGEGPGQAWIAHRYSVSYKMSTMFRAGVFVDTMEVASTWQLLPDLYRTVRAAIGQHAVVMAHFSHAYPEGCSIYFTFAAAAEDARAAARCYDAIWRDGLEATIRVGGTISHHHGIGILKAGHMAAEHREAMTIFEGIKRALDPDGIMNPGKLGLASGRFAATRAGARS